MCIRDRFYWTCINLNKPTALRNNYLFFDDFFVFLVLFEERKFIANNTDGFLHIIIMIQLISYKNSNHWLLIGICLSTNYRAWLKSSTIISFRPWLLAIILDSCIIWLSFEVIFCFYDYAFNIFYILTLYSWDKIGSTFWADKMYSLKVIRSSSGTFSREEKSGVIAWSLG